MVQPAQSFTSPLLCELVQGGENFEFRPGYEFPPIVGTYEALSYTWGDPIPVKPLVLDDKKIRITKNLDAALRHLRRTGAPRRLWIDALCIRQDDAADKNLFIPMMHKIYGSAVGKIVWLREATEDSDEAISILEDTVFGSGGRFLVPGSSL
jgi:hypothetical protein